MGFTVLYYLADRRFKQADGFSAGVMRCIVSHTVTQHLLLYRSEQELSRAAIEHNLWARGVIGSIRVAKHIFLSRHVFRGDWAIPQ